MSVETTELAVDTTYDLKTRKIIRVDTIRVRADTSYSLRLTMNGENVQHITRGDSSYAAVIAGIEFRIPCPFNPSGPFSTWGGRTIPAPSAPDQAVFLIATISGTPRLRINLRDGDCRFWEYEYAGSTSCFKTPVISLTTRFRDRPGGDYWVEIVPRGSFNLLVTYIPYPAETR
jgi:hypothetical protein